MAGTLSHPASEGQAEAESSAHSAAAGPRWAWPVLLSVMVAAAAVRAWRLDLAALTSDEAFSWRLTRYPLAEMVSRAAQDVHPPLFYLLLKPWTAGLPSPFTLRAVSLLLSVAAVAVVYALVLEAARFRRPAEAMSAGTRHGGALLAALLVALHPLQVQQGRNARMYALGVLLAALTSLVLLRALSTGALRWWASYALAAAAFAYTHYYALLTLAAQAAGALVLSRRSVRTQDQGPAWRGPALAALVALLLFAPWLPTLLAQARQVQEQYWIPRPTPATVEAALLRWTTGLAAGAASWLTFALLLMMAVWAAARAGRLGAFFLVQALLPWVLALGWSLLASRPLFLERFTVFAHVGLAAFWGVAWPRLTRAGRLLAVAALAWGTLLGLAEMMREYPARPPAVAQLVRYLRRWHQSGDVIVTDSPRALNKMRFYAEQAEVPDLVVRCLPGIEGGGHYTHLASLEPGELVTSPEQATAGPRLWRATEKADPVPRPPAGWTMGFARVFEGGDGSRYLLVRYDRGG